MIKEELKDYLLDLNSKPTEFYLVLKKSALRKMLAQNLKTHISNSHHFRFFFDVKNNEWGISGVSLIPTGNNEYYITKRELLVGIYAQNIALTDIISNFFKRIDDRMDTSNRICYVLLSDKVYSEMVGDSEYPFVMVQKSEVER